ncbi:MAG: tRNA (N(6)-L-threonylcarbamoyladenosine(37)-C(2))-methylthiotransferase MtaB [Lachnospiraceae bacterium]|nr:tRNA (N(6)-L-threonylcarbamoyladenosine(37)-C(2))-methylthiotransferase MtaB [Lachnospiraceae bacterium]
MKTAGFHNLGCKVNFYETEAMKEQLISDGYELRDFDDICDVYVINTCSVTNIADRKSRQMLHRARAKNPAAVIVAAGCYAQAQTEKLSYDPDIDIILGNNRKGELAQVLREYFERGERTSRVSDLKTSCAYENMTVNDSTEHTRAFVKVQDGCNQFCAYCIIPYVRGRIRSRSEDDIVREVTALADKGIKEIVLTGIHLSSYGLESAKGGEGSASDYLENGFATNALLDMIRACAEVDGIERIRLGSLEPRIITDRFASELAKIKKVCPHFHLSLQSGCDSVLKRMNRKYDRAQYMEGLEILRRAYDDPAITTDVIAGFPGESEEEFSQTLDYLKEIKLYETHIFKFSPRKGTVAAKMGGQLTDREKSARSAKLIELGKINARAFRERRIGRNVGVLWEDEETIGGVRYILGYTDEYIRVCAPAGSRVSGTLTQEVIEGFLEGDDEVMTVRTFE